MKKYFAYLLFILLSATFSNGCKLATDNTASTNTDNTGSGAVVLRGQVVDNSTNTPLAKASIKIIDGTTETDYFADSVGVYRITITVAQTKDIKIAASKSGYKSDTTQVNVTGGAVVDVPAFQLQAQNFATVNGQVVDNVSGNNLTGAVIRILTGYEEIQTITDAKGLYTSIVPLDKNKELTIIAVKEGYYADTTTIFATIGRTISIPLFKLKARNAVNVQTGNPASIYLVSQTAQSIGVRESGSTEACSLVWEVQDSSGVPVDIQHSALVEFNVKVSPGGGEFVSPATVQTNALGRVTLNISSGTKAGVMQLLAQIKLPARTVQSKPVSIAIHGGLPDQTHFSIAPEKLNIAGYDVNGVIDIITAYAGDKYGNPVRQKTALYFTTDGGYIEGSALTNDMGIGSARLMSAEPRPVHPVLGKGFATVTTTTADENYNVVKGQCIVLFSGVPYLSITPTTIDLPHLGNQTFYYTLMDENGNPLSSGTSISVQVEGDNIKATGDVSVRMPDTQSKGWTQFAFTLVSKDTSTTPRPIGIAVIAEGPNGAAKVRIGGIAR
ncbi:MAG: hypothetical protein WCJ01_10775 [Ignavibacteria bacterium]